MLGFQMNSDMINLSSSVDPKSHCNGFLSLCSIFSSATLREDDFLQTKIDHSAIFGTFHGDIEARSVCFS